MVINIYIFYIEKIAVCYLCHFKSITSETCELSFSPGCWIWMYVWNTQKQLLQLSSHQASGVLFSINTEEFFSIMFHSNGVIFALGSELQTNSSCSILCYNTTCRLSGLCFYTANLTERSLWVTSFKTWKRLGLPKLLENLFRALMSLVTVTCNFISWF